MTTRIIDRAYGTGGEAGRLWFGILAAPVAWFAQLALAWAFVEIGCRIGLQHYVIADIDAILAIAAVLSILTGLVAVAGLITALNSRRNLGDEPEEDSASRWRRSHFMASVGVYLSILFVAVIILTFVPVAVLPTCTGPGGG